MNAYAVALKEERTWYDYYQLEAPLPYLPIAVFAAETRGQARFDALKSFVHEPQSAVYEDDFDLLTVKLLAKNVRVPRGRYSDSDSIWGLIPRDWPEFKRDTP